MMMREGEIIPKVVEIDVDARTADSKPYAFITHCPECGAELVRMEDEANYYCPNSKNCPPQIKGKIEHFVTRKAMDIALAGATIDQLYKAGLVKTSADLYTLTYNDVVTLDRFAEKSAKNLIDSIQASKSVPFARVLYAIGIRHIGETSAKTLAKKYKSLDAIQNATLEELQSTEDVGEIIAASIKNYFADPDNIQFIEKLKANGIQFEETGSTQAVSNVLEGKTIVISGTFEKHSRDEMKELIEAYGGKNVSGVSRNTTYLLAGDGIGPSKLEKAQSFGVSIIDEETFYQMIGLGDSSADIQETPTKQDDQQNNANQQLSLF